MKKLSILLAALFFVVVLEVNAQENTNTSIKFEKVSWTEVVAKAKAENKLIFLDAFASWCGPCKYMAKNIFTNSDVAGFYNSNFINAKIDMEKGEGIELAKKYSVNAYPTFLFIDGDGNVMHQACGGREADEFIQLGNLAFKNDMNTSGYINRFKDNSRNDGSIISGAFMNEYISVLSEACISTTKELNEYFFGLNEKEFMTPDNVSLLFNYVNDYENKGFQFFIKNQMKFSGLEDNSGELLSDSKIENKIKDVYSYSIRSASKKKDRNEFDKIQREIKASTLPIKDELVISSDMTWYKYQKNWAKYADVAMLYVPKYAMDDYREVNSVGWTFYENVDDLKALAQAAIWVQSSFDIKTEYSNMDTYAALLFKLGKKDEAMEAANKAIQLAEKEGADSEETYGLIEKIEALN